MRTSTQYDFIDADDFLSDHFQFDSSLNNFYNISQIIPECNMDKVRCSKDSNTNNKVHFC